MDTRTWDVVALGEAMVEFNQTAPNEPHYLQGFGGDTSNAVIAAARAGARTAYLTRIGADGFGRSLLQLWANEGVNTSGVTTASTSPTGIYFVSHCQQGHEFQYLRANSAASRMTPQWLNGAPSECIRNAFFLHLSGISLALSASACDTGFEAMQAAREAGTRVAFDANLRLKLWPLARARACIAQAVSMCDVFLPSLDDMQILTGLDAPDDILLWSHDHGAQTVVLKLGSEGTLISDGRERLHVPGRQVTVRDATGAGDCFCGNLLARLAKGDDVFAAARYANAAAALSVQGFGAVAPMPRASAVFAALLV